MVVKTVGNPPPSADDLRTNLEQQLPEIMTHFNQVLQEQFGFQGVRVGGFTVVPADAAASGISCDEESCSVAEAKA
ncbi:hypothetical protein S7335_695 [Synechococcus sp. PCC 7335]|uniref:hypothetical protein n=1 Tax=Synechococcus sp. (strain ATCC 29403 / PCC 7335) TaxID=91464 RepID=UPI00017EC7F8|nr:hypothetical protein [Synechococcus sp. PCC 7335]EDX83515.1 hypothetical protein S7335_695 [Synechococcus sp. PCC 7335]